MASSIRNLLVLGLIAACMPVISAAPATKAKKIEAKTTKKTVTKTKGFSLKTKAIAAVSVVATVAIAYLVYRYKTGKTEVTLDDILRYEPQQAPAYQVPAGQAGRLMRNLEAHNENFQQAMRNAENRANIEALFNNDEFAELMEGRLANYIGIQLAALFNDAQILDVSAQPNFSQSVINRFRESLRKIEQ